MPIPQVNDRIKEAPVVVLRAVFAGIGQILLTADKVRARAAEQGWADRATALAPRPSSGLRNWATHAEPAAAPHAAIREAAATPGTATATKAPAAPPRETGSTLAGSLPSPSSGASRQPKARPTAKATRVTPAAKSPAAKSISATKSTSATKSPSAAKAAPTAKTAPATGTPAKAGRAAKPTKTVPAPRSAKAEPAKAAPPLPGWDDISVASLRARLRGLDPAAIRGMLAYEQAHARREPVITMLERRLAKITAG